MVDIPNALVWDYTTPPEDLLWRLQRIADFFPTYGRDAETVALLYQHRAELHLDHATRILIEEYDRAWKIKLSRNRESPIGESAR